MARSLEETKNDFLSKEVNNETIDPPIPEIKSVLPVPRDYPYVSYRLGQEYWDYSLYRIREPIYIHDFRCHNFRGKGTFSRCYDAYLKNDPKRILNWVIKVIRRSKEFQNTKIQREIAVLDKIVGGPGVVRYYGMIEDKKNKLWENIPDDFAQIEQEDKNQLKDDNDQVLLSRKRSRKAMVFENVVDMKWKQTVPTLSEGQLAFLMFQLLITLDYAHSHGIMHRDIKPLNCLLSKK